MKPLVCTKSVKPSAESQKGGMLIESLIGMLILSLIGGGVMHATSRMTSSQHEMTINNLSVNQMRTMLMTRSDGGADLCSGSHSISLPGQQEAQTLTVKGCATAPAKINGIRIGGSAVPEQSIDAIQPLVLEMGRGETLVRVGGAVADEE